MATITINGFLKYYFDDAKRYSIACSGRDSVAAMLKNLGSDSTVFIANENGFNEIAGLQSNITSELLAKVESIENTIAEVGKNVNSSSKKVIL